MTNDHLVPPPISRNRKIGIIWAAILLLGSIPATTALAADTRISAGFEPFEASANERVSQAFEDIRDLAPVSDELKTALASLSQNMQANEKPPVRAEGNE